MKICRTCGIKKPETEFNKWSKGKDGLYYKCKPCRREYDNAHYKNSSTRRAKVREVDRRNQERNRALMVELKKNSKCADCGNDDYVVLEFDHLRDKEYNISRMMSNGRSWAAILKEIE